VNVYRPAASVVVVAIAIAPEYRTTVTPLTPVSPLFSIPSLFVSFQTVSPSVSR